MRFFFAFPPLPWRFPAREILLSAYVDGELFGMTFPARGKLYARGVVIAALQRRAAFGSGGKAGRPVAAEKRDAPS